MFFFTAFLLTHAPLYFFFFFNDTATTEIYTLSLHDALPISPSRPGPRSGCLARPRSALNPGKRRRDRKSTRLNSSHMSISYAVFCLKKKKNIEVISYSKNYQNKHASDFAIIRYLTRYS